ncbi:hypothetical protein [Leekyejoonella antrihumi]|uniref:Nucleoside 2-deoxyribosyltransferase n=1 Tax=Leekyejoonella antrihumi TaxID=1660198 RepID=A0A563DZD1_9MICO|nr:hypothetical protein [Leekyejoonella antrihumi]TWP35322.1 hypothetical protein FGL98_14525 [Leekyejoonella antrihumi]
MKVYVAGPLADAEAVREVQSALVAAGHRLTLDWTQEALVAENYASRPDASAAMAHEMLAAVLDADAVIVVTSDDDGRGMFVELGAALARAATGALDHVVVVGPIRRESIFYFHPHVRRVATIEDWLTSVD